MVGGREGGDGGERSLIRDNPCLASFGVVPRHDLIRARARSPPPSSPALNISNISASAQYRAAVSRRNTYVSRVLLRYYIRSEAQLSSPYNAASASQIPGERDDLKRVLLGERDRNTADARNQTLRRSSGARARARTSPCVTADKSTGERRTLKNRISRDTSDRVCSAHAGDHECERNRRNLSSPSPGGYEKRDRRTGEENGRELLRRRDAS